MEDIKKFTNDENVWYHIMVPDEFDYKDMTNFADMIDESGIKAKFILTSNEFKITDITPSMTEYIKDNIK